MSLCVDVYGVGWWCPLIVDESQKQPINILCTILTLEYACYIHEDWCTCLLPSFSLRCFSLLYFSLSAALCLIDGPEVCLYYCWSVDHGDASGIGTASALNRAWRQQLADPSACVHKLFFSCSTPLLAEIFLSENQCLYFCVLISFWVNCFQIFVLVLLFSVRGWPLCHHLLWFAQQG